jgi:hypothetical protein
MPKWVLRFRINIGPQTRTEWSKNELVWDVPGMSMYQPSADCLSIDRVDHYCDLCESVPLSYHTGFTLILFSWAQISCYYERYTPEMYND